MKRLSLAFVVLVAALLAGGVPGVGGSVLGVESAQAAKCKQRGASKVCISVRKQRCTPGRPTFCERFRNECRFKGKKGFFSCVYKAKQARCRGSDGRRCRTTYINCTSNQRKRVCEDFTASHCSSNKQRKQCQTIRNRCLTGRGRYYRCTYTRRRKVCPTKKPCYRETKICVSRSGASRASCSGKRYTVARDAGPGGTNDEDNTPGGGDGGSPGSGGTTDPEQPASGTTDPDAPTDGGDSGGGTITPLRR